MSRTTLSPTALPGIPYIFTAKGEATGVFDFAGWLSQNNPSIVQNSASLRAQIQYARILDKPTTVVLTRPNVGELAAQVVRIEWTESLTDVESELGMAVMRRGYIMGFKNHPTLPDLQAQEWDVFTLGNREYTIKSVNRFHLIGQVQAQFEAV